MSIYMYTYMHIYICVYVNVFINILVCIYMNYHSCVLDHIRVPMKFLDEGSGHIRSSFLLPSLSLYSHEHRLYLSVCQSVPPIPLLHHKEIYRSAFALLLFAHNNPTASSLFKTRLSSLINMHIRIHIYIV